MTFMNPEIQKAVENFLLLIEDLIYEFGEPAVLSAFEQVLPGVVAADAVTLPDELMLEQSATPKPRGIGKIWAGLKKILGLGAGGAGVAGVGALGRVATSDIDQDVSIDDIQTDKSLNVTDKALQDTNDALETMIRTLIQTQKEISSNLQGIDISIDDLITAETGESTLQVQNRQAGVATAATKRDRVDDEEKDQ